MEEIRTSENIRPETVGASFNSLDPFDFVQYLRTLVKDDPSVRISVVADWIDVHKARSAKALLDQYRERLNIDSFTIRATRAQYEEDVNAFASGVQWEEIEE